MLSWCNQVLRWNDTLIASFEGILIIFRDGVINIPQAFPKRISNVDNLFQGRRSFELTPKSPKKPVTQFHALVKVLRYRFLHGLLPGDVDQKLLKRPNLRQFISELLKPLIRPFRLRAGIRGKGFLRFNNCVLQTPKLPLFFRAVKSLLGGNRRIKVHRPHQ